MNFHKHCLVRPHQKVDLSKYDPDDTGSYRDKDSAHEELQKTLEKLTHLQARLHAEGKRALLIVLQAMDTGGKDGTIRSVFSGVNPLGCRVTSFKVPSAEEAAHDFLWRVHHAVPPRGYIGIFNRSHYEDVLVVRVHNLVPKSVWSKRYEQINQFEEILTRNDVTILKFYLHISKQEQRERLLERLDDPEKNWKFEMNDLEERKRWEDYMEAFETLLSRCSPARAPWFIIPANKKWFRNLAVSKIIVQTLEEMQIKYPKPRENLSKVVVK